MSTVTCKRCGRTAPGLERAPLPGEAGELVRQGSCLDCWELWKGEQVKLINEEQLSPVNPEHYALLVSRMRSWLELDRE